MKSDLSSLYAPPPLPRPEHCSELEATLLRDFDARPGTARPWTRSRAFRGLAVASLLVAGLAAASQAPVEHMVTVGYRFTIELPRGASLPPLDSLSSALHGAQPAGAQRVEVSVRAELSEAQQATLLADVWSEAAPADIENKLRALPELAGATISVTTLEGQVRETLGARLAEKFLDISSDPASIEAARRQVQAELAARGETGNVDVQVDDAQPGQKRVQVTVTKDAPAAKSP